MKLIKNIFAAFIFAPHEHEPPKLPKSSELESSKSKRQTAGFSNEKPGANPISFVEALYLLGQY